ncbi:hypothetical protein QUF55_10015 [Clostridiaceae bacterium HSG29]|nr:hypothetical protein [Clostridiaceae bacterium HSG29]
MKFKTNVEKRTVIVDNIIINGFFSFSDGGKVFLIVNNGATFNSEFLNANENLIILIRDTASININIPLNGKFYSYVYAKNENVNISGSGEFYGAIIAKNLTNNLADTNNFIFVHPADVLSLKQYIKYNETYEYEFGYYEN